MPKRATVQRARPQLRRDRSASTAAGELVREEIHHIPQDKQGTRSTKQATAIGLSKALRAGVPLRIPTRSDTRTKRAATRTSAAGQPRERAPSRTPARAVSRTLGREPGRAAPDRALAAQAHTAATRTRKG